MGGGDTQQTTTESNPWAPAQGHITSGLDWAQQIVQNQATNIPQLGQVGINPNLQGAWDQMSGPGMQNLANYYGQMGAGMLGQLGGIYDQMGEMRENQLYDTQNLRDTLMGDKTAMLESQNAAQMAQLDKAMAQSTGQIYGQAAGGGNVGSSRTQLASGQATGNLAAAQAAQMSNLYSQAFDTSTNTAMQMNQQQQAGLQAQANAMGQLGSNLMGQAGNVYQQAINNQLQAGTGQMNLEQMNNLIQYQNAMNAWQAPQNLVGWYSGIAQGAGGLGGTGVTTQPIDRVGQIMGIAGSMGSAWLGSDERLKTNIKKVGRDVMLELDTYTWDWNEDIQNGIKEGYLDKGMWEGNKFGFIAQEVKEAYPEAVKESNGYLMVDYGYLLGLSQERSAAGGEHGLNA